MFWFKKKNLAKKYKENAINKQTYKGKSTKSLTNIPKKDKIFISPEDKLKITKFTKRLQSDLYKGTLLSGQLKQQFEELYKMVYYFSVNPKTLKNTSWSMYYDLLFLGEGHAIIISKYSFNVGPLLNINEIMNPNLTLTYLKSVFLRLEVIINQMIKLYNEGKNRNYTLIDSVKELKYLGLVSGLLYEKLHLIADVRKKLNKATNIRQIKILNSQEQVELLINLDIEFKFLLSEVYVDLVSIYTKIQEPYLKKFFYLWKDKELEMSKFNTFYQI